jgi:hypothetical protein
VLQKQFRPAPGRVLACSLSEGSARAGRSGAVLS